MHSTRIRRNLLLQNTDIASPLCVCVSVSVCLFVGHDREPCDNRPKCRFGLWTRVGQVTDGTRIPQRRGQFRAHLPAHCEAYGISGVRALDIFNLVR